MKKFLIITIALIMPMFLFGQSYSALWKQVSEAEEKDLPKTQYEVLRKIVKKAEKERQYGQLLKAELYAAQTMVDIAPDSLKPGVDRIVARYQKATDQVQRLVYQTVLWQIDRDNYSIDLGIKKPQLTPELCKLLANTKERSYQPFVVMGSDAVRYRLVIAQKDGQVAALQENWNLHSNDSTRKLWQQMRDEFEKELGAWPNMPKHGDDHKVAKFEGEGGFITLTLENTYRPTLAVRYDRK